MPNSINHKLGTLAKLFNINYEGAHRGLKDVEINTRIKSEEEKEEEELAEMIRNE